MKGNLPPQLVSLQNKLSTQQKESDGVDYIFDIPIEPFVSLGGIRYNEDIEGAEPEPWQVLTRIKARKWWWPFG